MKRKLMVNNIVSIIVDMLPRQAHMK